MKEKYKGVDKMDYVGECSVCNDSIDESEAGYCEICQQPFCWSYCGGWHSGNHICNNCQDKGRSDD